MTPGTPDIAELKRLARPFEVLLEQLDSMTMSDGDADPAPLSDSMPLHEALYEALGDECEATVGDLRRLIPSLLASAEENARLRAAVDKVTEACPKDNSEQDAFETWAESQHFEMNQHPLHYLFLDSKTDAARQGWKAALSYVRAALGAPKQTLLQEALFVCAACDGRGVSINQPEGCTDCLGSGRTLFGDSRSTS